MNGSGPAYLSELLDVYAQSRTLRTSDTSVIEQCNVPQITHTVANG